MAENSWTAADTSALVIGVGAIVATLITLWVSTALSQAALSHQRLSTEVELLMKVKAELSAIATNKPKEKMRLFGWMEIMITDGTISFEAWKEFFGDSIDDLIDDAVPLPTAADSPELWQNFANLLARVTPLAKDTNVVDFLFKGEGMLLRNTSYKLYAKLPTRVGFLLSKGVKAEGAFLPDVIPLLSILLKFISFFFVGGGYLLYFKRARAWKVVRIR